LGKGRGALKIRDPLPWGVEKLGWSPSPETPIRRSACAARDTSSLRSEPNGKMSQL
jgi:hypothetical protein